jgi:glycerol-3-phosphate dehydrogenase
MEKKSVVVIGAGSTGAATIRDLSMRGIDAVLLERGDLCSGTTGKCHGMLHSGGRYVPQDMEGASECIRETKILFKIAPHLLEVTGGMFVGFEEDERADPNFKDKKIRGCKECGIPVEEISVKKALEIEPSLSPEITQALWIPDEGTLHTFHFVINMCLDAKKLGADIRPYNEVIEILRDGKTVTGVRVKDHIKDRIYEIRSEVIISSSGPWAGKIAKMAGANVPINPTPGVMVVVNRRVVNHVINRLRRATDGDIILPHHTTAVIGTTSWPVDDPDKLPTPKDHVERMIKDGARMIPIVGESRLLRAYSAARPLIGLKEVPGRDISRTFEAFDHEKIDGIEGFVTITGGKMCTARAMAEAAVNLACNKLGIRVACTTDKEPIMGSEEEIDVAKLAEEYGLVKIYTQRAVDRLGPLTRQALDPIKTAPYRGCWLCTDEFVTRAEIEYAVKNLWAHYIYDIRRRTRQSMGTCRGGTCSHVVAGIQVEEFNWDPVAVHADLMSILKLRWAGDKLLLWGDNLRQYKLNEAIYSCLGNYDKLGKGLPFSMPIYGELPW